MSRSVGFHCFVVIVIIKVFFITFISEGGKVYFTCENSVKYLTCGSKDLLYLSLSKSLIKMVHQ